MKRKAQRRARLKAEDPERYQADVERRRKKSGKRNPEQKRQWYLNRKKVNPERYLLARVRQRHTKKFPKIPCDLEASDLLVPAHCPVFGYRMRWESFWRRPTVDRIDNSKGYVKGNVVIVSQRANQLKNDSTLDELRAIIKFYQQYE